MTTSNKSPLPAELPEKKMFVVLARVDGVPKPRPQFIAANFFLTDREAISFYNGREEESSHKSPPGELVAYFPKVEFSALFSLAPRALLRDLTGDQVNELADELKEILSIASLKREIQSSRARLHEFSVAARIEKEKFERQIEFLTSENQRLMVLVDKFLKKKAPPKAKGKSDSTKPAGKKISPR